MKNEPSRKAEPVAYIDPYDLERLPHYDCHIGSQQLKNGISLYTQDQLEEARKLGMQQGELLAVTYTDDEHRIVEVLWQRPPVKELTDEEILGCWVEEFTGNALPSIDFARAILLKAQEK